MIIDKLDSFISKARLGDILSYVPDITKPGHRTNLTKIFDLKNLKMNHLSLESSPRPNNMAVSDIIMICPRNY